jgi:DNA invertase Pin-like site-specific DNA recombinase
MSDSRLFYRDDHGRDIQSTDPSREAAMALRETYGNVPDSWIERADRAGVRKVLGRLGKGDVLMVTRLSRLARPTRDPLNTLAAVAVRDAGFRSLGDAWADTTTAHGRLMLTILGGLAEFERELIPARTGEGPERTRRGA